MLSDFPVLLFKKHFDTTENVDIKDIVNDPAIVEEAYRALRKKGLLAKRNWKVVLCRWNALFKTIGNPDTATEQGTTLRLYEASAILGRDARRTLDVSLYYGTPTKITFGVQPECDFHCVGGYKAKMLGGVRTLREGGDPVEMVRVWKIRKDN